MRRTVLVLSTALLVVTPGVCAIRIMDPGDSRDAVAELAGAKVSAAMVAASTPGDFTGLGFDQCVAPTQSAMDAWITHSPFRAVGIYISGDSRACRTQPNLSPTRVATRVSRGWRLLPIALGPQASCLSRFPRYADDFKISPSPDGSYAAARAQGVVEADKNATDAAALGIGPGSTLWYDPEAFDHGQHPLPRVGAGLRQLVGHPDQGARLRRRVLLQRELRHQDARRRPADRARCLRTARPHLDPRWDGVANTSTSYIAEDGWRPGGRMKQFKGGHNRDPGRGHDQHRQQLPRAQRFGRRTASASPAHADTRARDALRRHPGRLPGLLHTQAEGRQPSPAPSRCSACSRRRSGTSASWTVTTTARPAGPPERG
ncbi:glycoside hydrolase domain-containing protein [Nocardioides sp. B-3]|uniref:glycoside hydrolase domain-containing protein n=1 Tax=Nocardioides sp. B-3 TaxID=2895565 RepID=UPI00215391A7|nr:glycoside hydrolase domain-containing protein [Nocardioides sp. B-3]UUZ61539.1 DUF1906 domain-containing protein [Nocardioides sp. B-3]